MATPRKESTSPEEVQAGEMSTEEITTDVTGEVVEENTVSATDKLKVLNTSSKNICLTSGILHPGDIGIATRAEAGTLWQFLELAEK